MEGDQRQPMRFVDLPSGALFFLIDPANVPLADMPSTPMYLRLVIEYWLMREDADPEPVNAVELPGGHLCHFEGDQLVHC